MTENNYEEESNDGILHDLTASFSSRFWLAVFVVSVFALIATLVTMSNNGARSVDSSAVVAGEDAVLDETTEYPNRVNTAQLPDSSFIYDVSLDELANADPYLDGQTVQVTGEVVGDRIIAESDSAYCWITLQSTGKSDAELQVFMPVSQAASIDTYGAYGRRGTELQVRGTFNLACADHQGASELHSDHVAIVQKGKHEDMPFDPAGLIPGILLVLIGSISMLLYNVLQERQR